MVVGMFKRFLNRYDDSGPVLHVAGINYEEVLRLNKEDVSFDLNGKVPKLYIKGQEVGVVSMTTHYVTDSDMPGTNVITFSYITKDSPQSKTLSINRINGEVFNQ